MTAKKLLGAAMVTVFAFIFFGLLIAAHGPVGAAVTVVVSGVLCALLLGGLSLLESD